jgi:hypothetical protein
MGLCRFSVPLSRTGRNLESLLLSGSAGALLLVLYLFKPSLPAWLPAPVAQGFAMVERLSGDYSTYHPASL